ncbi:hypothetical protein ACIQXQ_20705 [Peribacillus sp. NPDC097198]|uniref:hypothetical protein n=1 Tax=Peribacillus sp. NPDC097198 TaxID=3364397 RepID=UPI00380FB9A9
MTQFSIESLRELLKNNGFDGKTIEIEVEKALAIENERKRQEKEENEKVKTTEQAATYLGQNLKGKWDGQKVRRLMREGKLDPIERPEKRVQKRGHRFHIDELNKYIKQHKMSREELLTENIELKKKIEELEKKLSGFTQDPVTEEKTSVGLIPTEPSESPKMDGLRTSETTDLEQVDVKTKKNEEKTDSANLVISKMEIVGEEGLHLYKIKFLLNKEVRFGLVSDDTNEENPMIQFVELWDENRTKVYTFGSNEEDNQYLESISFKTDKNVKRKISGFKKN